MKDYGENPGGKNELQPLLYPFHRSYPIKVWSKFRWFQNSRLQSLLSSLNKKRKWLTVIDRLGAPGDALITANVIHGIKQTFPNLKINCITPNPQLIELDPSIDSINQRETFYSFDSTYWELIVRKEKKQNVISYNLSRLGIQGIKYKANFYLSQNEIEWAKKTLCVHRKPIFAICCRSKESVKNWPLNCWTELIDSISQEFTIIQLGDNKEPILSNVIRYAGKHTMRESAALLSQANFFIGPDSLLMHIANGLNIKSIIIFGGSRPANCFGYKDNINLTTQPECSPCWIHDGYEKCAHKIKCMNTIKKSQVLHAVDLLSKSNSEINQNN